jgi:hypothetical protein
MFYVYKNTTDSSHAVAQFTDQEAALAYMEHLALRNLDPAATGYAVRDFSLNTYAEFEI